MELPTAPDDEQPKHVLASRTVWFNALLSAVVELSPDAARWVSTHPQTAVLIAAGGNYLLRHMTDGGLRYGPKKT